MDVVVLTNDDLDTQDVYEMTPERCKWTMKDLQTELGKKHGDKITGSLSRIGNIIYEKERNPLIFSVVTPNGDKVLGHSTLLKAAAARARKDSRGRSEILWTSDQMVGVSNQQFGFDAFAVRDFFRDEYEMNPMRPIIPNCRYAGGFYFSVLTSPTKYAYGGASEDADAIMARTTITVTPTSDYPETGPEFRCDNRFSHDPCWSDGKLSYAHMEGMSAWPVMVRKKGSEFVLTTIISMLATRYGFVMCNE